MSHLNFSILAFSTNFWSIKTDLSGNTVWPQALGFQKLAKLTIFGIFDLLLSTQNVNVARFARNVERDFLWFSNTVLMRILTSKLVQVNFPAFFQPLLQNGIVVWQNTGIFNLDEFAAGQNTHRLDYLCFGNLLLRRRS